MRKLETQNSKLKSGLAGGGNQLKRGHGKPWGRGWRYFRFLVLGGAFVLLGVYLFVATPWREKLGWMPGYGEQVEAGERIVGAMVRFRGERGMWPEYLEDLTPEYLKEGAGPEWNYVVTEEGPGLATATGTKRTSVGYDFEGGRWRVAGLMDNRELRAGTMTMGAAVGTATQGERVEAELRELDRRIAREPGEMEHRRYKASVLRAAGRMEEAEGVIREAMAADGEGYWPRLALAVLRMGEGDGAATQGEGADMAGFREWVAAHPSFTHWYYLSVAERLVGNGEGAAAAVEAGLKQPAAVGGDDPNILAFYLFDEGRLALGGGRGELAVRVADAWEKAGEAAPQRDYLALRAGGKVMLKDFAGAAADLAALEGGKGPAWAANVGALRGAVERRDGGFRYDPGAVPGAYRVFLLPP